jgi:hypothetical protein
MLFAGYRFGYSLSVPILENSVLRESLSLIARASVSISLLSRVVLTILPCGGLRYDNGGRERAELGLFQGPLRRHAGGTQYLNLTIQPYYTFAHLRVVVCYRLRPAGANRHRRSQSLILLWLMRTGLHFRYFAHASFRSSMNPRTRKQARRSQRHAHGMSGK